MGKTLFEAGPVSMGVAAQPGGPCLVVGVGSQALVLSRDASRELARALGQWSFEQNMADDAKALPNAAGPSEIDPPVVNAARAPALERRIGRWESDRREFELPRGGWVSGVRVVACRRLEWMSVSIPEGCGGTVSHLEAGDVVAVHWDGLDGPPLSCDAFSVAKEEGGRSAALALEAWEWLSATHVMIRRGGSFSVAQRVDKAETCLSAAVDWERDHDGQEKQWASEELHAAAAPTVGEGAARSPGAAALAGRALAERDAIVRWLRAGKANQPLLGIVADGIEAGQHLKGEG